MGNIAKSIVMDALDRLGAFLDFMLFSSIRHQGSKLRLAWSIRFAMWRNLLDIWCEQLLGRMGLILYVSKLNYRDTLMKAQLDAITTAVGNASLWYIYSGTQPSGPAGADGTLVVGPFTGGSPFAPGATTATPSVLSPTLPANVNASASIQPTWFRIKTSGGTALIDGSAATSTADMIIGPTTSGQPVAITAFTITNNNSGH